MRASSDLLTDAQYRDVIGRFATGVTVITASDGRNPYGTTASAVTSVSVDPPMLLICLNESSTTQRAIRASGLFAVNILSANQADLALQFSRKGHDKYDGVRWTAGLESLPVLANTLAVITCAVVQAVRGGTHSIFIARVLDAEAKDGEPLTYFRGSFGCLLDHT